MAMSNDAALIRCGDVYSVLRHALFEERKIKSEDEELILSSTFEEMGIDADSKERIYSHMRESLPALPENDEVKMQKLVTLRDMYNFVYNDYEESYGPVKDTQYWKFLSRRMIKYSHPAQAKYNLTFAPEEIRWDTIPFLAIGMSPDDLKMIAADFGNMFGIEFPSAVSVTDSFATIFQKSAEAVNDFGLLEKKSRAANKNEPELNPAGQKPAWSSFFLTLLSVALPLLIFAGILALIFSHI